MKISGIYKIVNKINGKYYVGSSYDICGKRWTDHKYKLNKNIHTNPKLQHAWNKYGKNNFYFSIEEQVSPENLLVVEQTHLDFCKNNPNLNYNISYDASAPMFGRKHTQETKQKMSENHHCFSFDEIEKMRLRRLGKKYSNETRQKMSEKATGKNHINYDHTIYNFFNIKIGEKYSGTRFDFQSTFRLKQCSVSALMLGRMKSLFGWTIVYSQH